MTQGFLRLYAAGGPNSGKSYLADVIFGVRLAKASLSLKTPFLDLWAYM